MERYDELLSGVYSSTVTDVAVLVREVRVRIGVLLKPVTIRIYHTRTREEPYRFELSAHMKTARERLPREAPRTAMSEGEALRRAVRMLTQDYEDAVRDGRLPNDDWLVESGEF